MGYKGTLARQKRLEKGVKMCDKRKSQEFCEKAYAKMEDVKEMAEDKIREKPITSVLIAAGVGAVAGVVVSEGIRAIVRSRR